MNKDNIEQAISLVKMAKANIRGALAIVNQEDLDCKYAIADQLESLASSVDRCVDYLQDAKPQDAG